MIPENSLLNTQQRDAANALIASLDLSQKAWLSGFLAAQSSGAGSAVTAKPSKVLVLFGTESGNAEALADKTAKAVKKKGGKPTLKNMAESKPSDLKNYDSVLTIVSTWGDGEPPEAAEDFHTAFMSEEVDLKGITFSVCALGDTSYDKFCETGKEFDARLEKLGAERLVDRADCDVDFDDTYDAWAKEILDKVCQSATPTIESFTGTIAPSGVEYGKKNPFPAEVLECQLINGPGTAKETIHLELDLEGSGLTYEAGDALAVIPTNCEQVVTDILLATGSRHHSSLKKHH